MLNNKFKFEKYVEVNKEFVTDCWNNSLYQEFIGKSESTDNIYIINYEDPIGILKVYDINTEDLNLSINVFIVENHISKSGLALLKAIDFTFYQYKTHKIILKVFDKNKKMINILNRLSICYEGKVITDNKKNRYVNIYSILKDEYHSMSDSKWRNVLNRR